MLFDRLCWLAEHMQLPSANEYFQGMVKQARVFMFDYAPHEVLPKNITQEHFEEFRMPFPVVAVEDKASCCVIADTDHDHEGMNSKRLFIDIVRCTRDSMQACRNAQISVEKYEELYAEFGEQVHQAYMVTMGIINSIEWLSEKHYKIDGTVGTMFGWVGKQADSIEFNKDIPEQLSAEILKNYVTALEEVDVFMDPDYFIMESVNTKAQSKTSTKKIPRSHQRPLYTMLKPREIRTRMQLPEPSMPTGAKRRPHERRGHYRVYTHERYRFIRGRKKWIPSTWIGPSENTVGNHRYRVVLEPKKEGE